MTNPQTSPARIEYLRVENYRERRGLPLITYHLAIDEVRKGPIGVEEWLHWRRGQRGRPFRFLEYHEGQGRAVSGEMPDEADERVEIPLRSPDLIAVNTLGQFADHPRVAALREFINDWKLSCANYCPTYWEMCILRFVPY